MPKRHASPLTLEQLGQIVEGSASETYIFDSESFEFLLVNRGARQNLGYTAEEIRRLTPWHIKPQLTERQFKDLIAPLLSGDENEMVFETVHQRKDESCYDVSVHLQLIPADGQPFFFAAIRDVTDERRLIRENQRQNEELKAALVAKDFLLREIHHRVKNSLAVVSALLGLQGRQAKSADASSALLQAQERVQVIASIHERLYQDDVQDRIDLSELLEDLGDKTIALMSDGERITFEADVERGMVTSLDRSVPIALVVIEVMINSIKHAFPDGASGVISLGVRLEGDGATIEVSDNGVGMEASDPSAQGSGLGSRIINGLSAQAGAEVSMKSSDKGTHYTLTLPLLH